MSRRCASLTLDNLADLPLQCRRCVFWELDPAAGETAEAAGGLELEKEAWLSATLLAWGSCGMIAYVDSMPAGYVTYAPPVHVPRSLAFPTSPASGDAVLLMTVAVRPEFADGGLGRMLVQAAARDLTRRGVKALEAFGRIDVATREPARCTVPADFLLAVGFRTVRPHHRHPRLRMDLRSTLPALSWREDVEVALERLMGSMSPEPALRPA